MRPSPSHLDDKLARPLLRDEQVLALDVTVDDGRVPTTWSREATVRHGCDKV